MHSSQLPVHVSYTPVLYCAQYVILLVEFSREVNLPESIESFWREDSLLAIGSNRTSSTSWQLYQQIRVILFWWVLHVLPKPGIIYMCNTHMFYVGSTRGHRAGMTGMTISESMISKILRLLTSLYSHLWLCKINTDNCVQPSIYKFQRIPQFIIKASTTGRP